MAPTSQQHDFMVFLKSTKQHAYAPHSFSLWQLIPEYRCYKPQMSHTCMYLCTIDVRNKNLDNFLIIRRLKAIFGFLSDIHYVK